MHLRPSPARVHRQARDFCDWLGSPKAPALKALPFGVLALGDKAYVHFCRCGKTLDARFEASSAPHSRPTARCPRRSRPRTAAAPPPRFSPLASPRLSHLRRPQELGGKRVVDRVDVDREDWPVVDAWISSALDALVALKLKPQARRRDTPPAFVDLLTPPPTAPRARAPCAPRLSRRPPPPPEPLPAAGAQMPKALANGNGVHADAPAAALPPSKSRPYSAKLVAKEGLCTLSGARLGGPGRPLSLSPDHPACPESPAPSTGLTPPSPFPRLPRRSGDRRRPRRQGHHPPRVRHRRLRPRVPAGCAWVAGKATRWVLHVLRHRVPSPRRGFARRRF